MTARKAYRFMDKAVGYIAPALFFVSATMAYDANILGAILAAVWGVGAVTMFNRIELDQLRKEAVKINYNQRVLGRVYEDMATDLYEAAREGEREQEETTR